MQRPIKTIAQTLLALGLLIFIHTVAAAAPLSSSVFLTKWTGDLNGMEKRRFIRVLVPYNKAFYFLDKGATQRGMMFDIMTAFEKELNVKAANKNLRLTVSFIPTAREKLIPDLLAGKGDVIAANLTITPERQALVDFVTPLAKGVREIIVTSPNAPVLEKIEDLAGKEIFVNPSTSYAQSLKELNEDFKKKGLAPVIIKDAPGTFETDDMFEMLQADLAKITVSDRYLAIFWKQIFPSIKLYDNLVLRQDADIAFAIRKDSPLLKAALDTFIEKNKIGTSLGNQKLQEYLKSVKWAKNATEPGQLERFGGLANTFQTYSEQYELDWLLMAAQGYQESGLNHSVKSPVGAIGVMQIMPATGNDLKVGDIHVVNNNIHGGVKYMRNLIDKYFRHEQMTTLDKGLFALASYNAGPAKIRQLRAEAKKRGLDPNIWFDNVERIAAEKIGRETVQYVSNIYKYYIAYRLVREQVVTQENTQPAQ